MKRNNSIPIIMYHSVGRPIDGWEWSFLTIDHKIFEDHLRLLKKAGYKTVNLDQLYEHVSGESILPRKTVMITFDDGYVDNWTYAAPLLRKYGFCATVVVNPEFVDPENVERKTLEHVWRNEIKEEKLEVDGFMSWQELKSLDSEGLIYVESHAMTHTWYPVSDKIVDYVRPGKNPYWMIWNSDVASKPFYLKKLSEENESYGAPIYENRKSLEARVFFPDPGEADHLTEFVAKNGGEHYFEKPDWKARLDQEIEKIRQNRTNKEKYENETETLKRYEWELAEAKKIIEDRLDKEINYFFWPGGGYNESSMRIATSIYKAVTLNQRDRHKTKNRPGDATSSIRRFGVPHLELNGTVFYPGGRYLLSFLEDYMYENRMAKFKRLFYKLINVAHLSILNKLKIETRKTIF